MRGCIARHHQTGLDRQQMITKPVDDKGVPNIRRDGAKYCGPNRQARKTRYRLAPPGAVPMKRTGGDLRPARLDLPQCSAAADCVRKWNARTFSSPGRWRRMPMPSLRSKTNRHQASAEWTVRIGRAKSAAAAGRHPSSARIDPAHGLNGASHRRLIGAAVVIAILVILVVLHVVGPRAPIGIGSSNDSLETLRYLFGHGR